MSRIVSFSTYQAAYIAAADWEETGSVAQAKACQTALKRMLAYAEASAKGDSSFKAPTDRWQAELEAIRDFLASNNTSTNSQMPVAYSLEESRS